MSRVVALAFALVALLQALPEARAASPTERLRGFFASAARALDDPRPEIKPEERLSAIRALVRDIFDFREAAQLSLGPDWSARTQAERAEFVRLFADLLERSFIAGIAARIRLADGVQVSFIDESVNGALATVRTAIAIKSGLDLPFDYRMIERGQRWAVRDVVVDGVSLASNYRAQFGRIMQTSSYGELLRQLRARVPGTAMLAMAAVAEETNVAPPSSLAPAAADSPWTGSSEAAGPQPLQEVTPDAPPREAVIAPPAPAIQPKLTIALAQPEAPPTRPAGILTKSSVTEALVAAPAVLGARLPPDATPAIRATSTRPARARSYWVQVGAFTNLETARRLAASLEEQEPTASPNRWVVVIEMVESGEPLARVRVGPFTARAEAASKLKDVQTRGYKPFIAEGHD